MILIIFFSINLLVYLISDWLINGILFRCLLKEDRNNLDLVVKFAELEYEMEGYTVAQPILGNY